MMFQNQGQFQGFWLSEWQFLITNKLPWLFYVVIGFLPYILLAEFDKKSKKI